MPKAEPITTTIAAIEAEFELVSCRWFDGSWRPAATIGDVLVRLQGSDYALTAVNALGWGMGPAQDGIERAVELCVHLGLVAMEKSGCIENPGKSMVRLTNAGRASAPIAHLYGDVSGRCQCGDTLTRLNTGAWVHGWSHERQCRS
jgi:hypothetical protein